MKKKKEHKAIEWYIKGEYHCDKCPFGWDDYSMAGKAHERSKQNANRI